MQQIPLAIGPVAEARFDNYLPGPNTAAWAELQALAGLPPLGDGDSPRPAAGLAGASPAPVYLWGPRGSGKTHLLQALAQRLRAAGAGVGWFDAALPQPWPWSPAWRLVVLDGCDAFDAAAQQAAFALFVEAATQGTQVAAAGRLPPVDLPLRDDLKTRLAWGHVLALQPLGDADARAVLQRRARERGLPLPDEVLDYLLVRVERDLGTLTALLDRLDDRGLAQGRHITVPLVRSVLSEPEALARPTADRPA